MRKSQLTKRQREVLILVGQGLLSKEIAEKLKISESAVSNHLIFIFLKTGAQNRIEAVMNALRNNQIRLEDIPRRPQFVGAQEVDV